MPAIAPYGDYTDEAMPPKVSVAAVMGRVERLEEQRDEASARLRVELDELRKQFAAVVARPMEVDNIRFPPRMVAAIVASAITVFGGMYASTYGLRSDVRDILTTLANQERIKVEQQKLVDEKQRLADERFQSLRDAVGVIDKRQQLQQIETQELKEMVLQTRSRTNE